MSFSAFVLQHSSAKRLFYFSCYLATITKTVHTSAKLSILLSSILWYSLQPQQLQQTFLFPVRSRSWGAKRSPTAWFRITKTQLPTTRRFSQSQKIYYGTVYKTGLSFYRNLHCNNEKNRFAEDRSGKVKIIDATSKIILRKAVLQTFF